MDELYEKFAVAGIDVLEGGNLLNLDFDLNDKDLNKSTMHDSIQMYLKEIGQYPLIHASDEKDLAKRIEHGDLEAKNLLGSRQFAFGGFNRQKICRQVRQFDLA